MADGFDQGTELFSGTSLFVEAYPIGITRGRACTTRINVFRFFKENLVLKTSSFFFSPKLLFWLEITSCVVTGIIWCRRSITASFLSAPPTILLVASWSTEYNCFCKPLTIIPDVILRLSLQIGTGYQTIRQYFIRATPLKEDRRDDRTSLTSSQRKRCRTNQHQTAPGQGAKQLHMGHTDPFKL